MDMGKERGRRGKSAVLLLVASLFFLRGSCQPPPIPPELATDGQIQIAVESTKKTDIKFVIVRFLGIEAVVSDTFDGQQRVETISQLGGALSFTNLDRAKQQVIMEIGVPDGFLWQLRFKVADPCCTIGFAGKPAASARIPSGAQTGAKLFALEGPIEIRGDQKAKLLIRFDPEKDVVCNKGQGCQIKPTLKGEQRPPDPVVKRDFIEGEVTVFFKEGTTREQVETLIEQIGATILREPSKLELQLDPRPIYVIGLPEGMTELAAIRFFEASPLVFFASWSFVGTAREPLLQQRKRTEATTEPFWSDQIRYLNAIDVPLAWDETTGSEDVRVVVLDTGVDLSHPDLVPNLNEALGKDFVEGDADLDGPDDQNGHGTSVAGLIAADGDNGLDIAGVNWQLELVPVRLLDSMAVFRLVDLLNALRFIKDDVPDVVAVNMSFGRTFAGITEEKVPNLERWIELYEDAFSEDILYIMAAPNISENLDQCGKPVTRDGCFDLPTQLDVPHKIVVGAIDSVSPFTIAPFSAFGQESIDLFAPGMDSQSPGQGLVTLTVNAPGTPNRVQGTSFATALTTGVVALVAAHRPDLRDKPGKLRTVILRSADVLHNLSGLCTSNELGCGKLDAFGALLATPEPPLRLAQR